MRNLKVNSLMNEVVEKLDNNQMSSLRGGAVKRSPIDHIGPVNKSPDRDKDKDDSDSNIFISKHDVMRSSAEAEAEEKSEKKFGR